jgi:DNA-binding transcriptional regulator LsrR (DeoR family)
MSLFPNDFSLSNLEIVPLFGAPIKEHEYELNESIKTFSQKTGARPVFAYFPEKATSIEDKTLYDQSHYYHHMNQKWDGLDFILFTVEKALPYNVDTALSSSQEADVSPVACFCAHRIDRNGLFINDEYEKKIIGISEHQLRRIPIQMCIAIGHENAHSALATLNTMLVSHLILDENLANRVLEICMDYSNNR